MLNSFFSLLKRRLLKTTIYAFHGFVHSFKNEEAFRIEVIVFFVSLPFAFLIASSASELIVLISVGVLVMIVEQLNTGIEIVVDKFGKEYSDSSKNAKDVASSAVFLSLVIYVTVWLYTIFS